jgi:dynein heavy chain
VDCRDVAQLEVEEKAAEKSATEAQTLRDQCDADLEASMPPLRRALKELQNINKGDIAELKSLKNPPVSVKVVMKAVCHMLGCIPQGVLDRRSMEPEVEDALWWRESMKLLGQINFMEILLTFDKNSIPQSVIDQASPFTPSALPLPHMNAHSRWPHVT